MNSSKYIVVVGATGGIGNSIVKKVVASGFVVIAASENEDKLFSLQNVYGKNNIIPYKVNLMETESIVSFQKSIEKTTDQIEWLIHSAGFIDTHDSLLHTDDSIMRKTFIINAESVIKLSSLLLPKIKEDGGVITISSTASLWGNPKYPSYAASKGAVNTYAQILAQHMSTGRQSSITICPGPTNTLMRERIAHDAANQQSPEVIANIIINIVKGVSSYKNGDVVIIRNNLETLHSQIN